MFALASGVRVASVFSSSARGAVPTPDGSELLVPMMRGVWSRLCMETDQRKTHQCLPKMDGCEGLAMDVPTKQAFVSGRRLVSEPGFVSFQNLDSSCFGTRVKWSPEARKWFLGSGFWEVVSGKWFLGSGFWEVVSGKWFLGSGFREVVSGGWFLGSGFWEVVSGGWFLGSGFWEVVSGKWFLASGFWEVVSGKWLPGSGFWGLVSGKWFLGSGFWRLVSGDWFLGSGFWGLVSEKRSCFEGVVVKA